MCKRSRVVGIVKQSDKGVCESECYVVHKREIFFFERSRFLHHLGRLFGTIFGPFKVAVPQARFP